jgi:hypothetical protein
MKIFAGCDDFSKIVGRPILAAAGFPAGFGCGSAALWGLAFSLPPGFARRARGC